MTARLGRMLALGLLALLLVLLMATAGLWWRLSQGPVSLSFLRTQAENLVNDAIASTGLRLQTADIILELDEESAVPLVRLYEVRLVDDTGRVLVHAPRGQVGLDAASLLHGRFAVHSFDLIGPRITIRRLKDGRVEMGFRPTGKAARRTRSRTGAGKENARATRSDASPPDERDGADNAGMPVERLALSTVLRFIDEQIFAPEDKGSELAKLEVIHIKRASISYYDERNDLLLFAPRADLDFQRVPYGYVLFARGDISSGGRPWRTEITATFRRKARTYTVAARAYDVVLAELARNVFAISQLAQMNLPLSGHAEATLTHDGRLLSASAELSVGPGKVDFPGYIARPAEIREGLIRIDYRPQENLFLLHPSLVFINGSPTELSGRFVPQMTDGRVRAIDVRMQLGRGDVKSPVKRGQLVIDHMMLDGEIRLDAAELRVRDFLMRAGTGVIRMRGRFVGEDGGVGVYIAGRGHNIAGRVIKKLWPPILASGARKWLRENLIRGRIPQGTFQLAIPGTVIAAAIERDEPVPDRMAKIVFTIDGAEFTYLKGLPPVRNAKGRAEMTGNHFLLEMDAGVSALPSGKTLRLAAGTMKVRDLARKVSPATIDVRVAGDANALAELLDMPALGLLSRAGFDRRRIGGKADVNLLFDLPLSRDLTADRIGVRATARINDARLSGLPGDIAIDGGQLDLTLERSRLTARGNVRLSGIPAKLKWSRDLSRPESQIELSMTLDDARRRKLGFDLAPWLSGSMPMVMKAAAMNGQVAAADISVNLSKVRMRIDPIGWHRPPVKGTRATLRADFSRKGRIAIRKLSIRGRGLRIDGELNLKEGGGLIDARFPRLELDAANRLAVTLAMRKGRLEVVAAGRSFDARPIIRRLLGGTGEDRAPRLASRGPTSLTPAGRSGERKPPPCTEPPVRVQVNIERVVAERGENVFNVRGTAAMRECLLTRLDLSGVLSSGRALSVGLTAAADGLRRLRIQAGDAGAVLRASGLYSKIFGGRMEFSALLRTDNTVRKGLLVIRDFEVRNETRLSEITRKNRKRRRGPRRGMQFRKLILPFSTDTRFVRIGNALVRGDELGATANGIIRRADLAMDIGGTIIPAYALNAAIGKVPIIGQLLTGGGGQGVIGLTFALRGTMHRPKFVVNPASALAPGILRQLFQMGGNNVNPDGTPRRRTSRRPQVR